MANFPRGITGPTGCLNRLPRPSGLAHVHHGFSDIEHLVKKATTARLRFTRDTKADDAVRPSVYDRSLDLRSKDPVFEAAFKSWEKDMGGSDESGAERFERRPVVQKGF